MKENINENRLKEQCIEMAAILGLDEPVSEKVLLTALADPNYAHHLLVVRNETEFLQYLLMHPPVLAEQEVVDIPTTMLLKRAAQSLLKWAGTGFSTVSDETYERRVNACKTCPNLRVPSSEQNALYGMAGALNHKSVCSKCGCVVKVKARRGTDTCPDQHPFKVGENRWEEQYLETDN